MNSFRIIPRLDIKGNEIIKSINFEGMRKVGRAQDFAEKYFLEGADELVINDVNASLFGRNTAIEFLKISCEKIFIPVTLSGGFRNLEDIRVAMINGADKVSVNTGAVYNKKLISKAAKIYGNQAIVVTVDVKKISNKKWEVLIDKGRERTRIDAIDWIKFVEKSGAGEIHLNSVDQEGTEKGFDIELIKKVGKNCKIPLVVGGGLGLPKHLDPLLELDFIDGLSAAACFHYDNLKIKEVKNYLKKKKNIRI